MRERHDEELPEENLPVSSEIEAEMLSPEEQEQIAQEMYEYQDGLRAILADRQADFAAELDEENAKILAGEIAELEETIGGFEEFLDDVTPE
ncbi:MAG: hypothetical protein A3J58_03675 [Candidatus Sungbacteria bacterium RIFCSPHIGHO2_02_FULL_52_23]|uniref:Uncharacterized protein n=1 Tax=Candidatus Sungbacteria bacterium RIFCSPHIGHO2_02_FULL_52_23 TaxID=1802274 RepID=A0A1G2KSF5_9BACT|nr:MAG: hypothetical protein A3J58_03675 [Candidatus Sungbacteria bacterium RIFCSPHIGHO2_02_FULL_52_23]